MKKAPIANALFVALPVVSLSFVSGCQSKNKTTSEPAPQCCAAYQRSDSLPDQPGPGVVRLAIGGDSRNDKSLVLPWAFKEAKRRAAKAFFFLGDLEITASLDKRIRPEIADLGGVPFYPLMGNHEVEFMGILPVADRKRAVKKFKENFLPASGVKFAPLDDVVVYSADLEGNIHFIALDNVSRKGEGFGKDQHDWLEQDLKTASAANKVILVGMHKGLANNPITKHAMDEDHEPAISDSNDALRLFHDYHVATVFVSHSHRYAAFDQNGVQVRLTGGLGAPLVKGLAEADGGFHHFLVVDVPPGANNTTPVQVEVVKFKGQPSEDTQDEMQEVD